MKATKICGTALMGAFLLGSVGCYNTAVRDDGYGPGYAEPEINESWRDIDEEFYDPDEPGDEYGTETESMLPGAWGESGEPADTGELDFLRDWDEEYFDPDEPGDLYGGETESMAPASPEDSKQYDGPRQ